MEMVNNKGISGLTLKLIAIVTMLIDHIGATIIWTMINKASTGDININLQVWTMVYQIMRGIGRMAFPIFCFLLVEGFNYTSNKKRYAFRLFLFALISEIPFDLAFNKAVLEFSYNNVFFTLFIGFMVIWGIDGMKRFDGIFGKKDTAVKYFAVTLIRCIAMMVIILSGMGLAEYLLNTDYSAAGVAAIVILYLLRSYPKTGFVGAVILLGILASQWEYLALFMLFPIAFYNGTRGRQLKYFFYIFYPAHLLILALGSFLLF